MTRLPDSVDSRAQVEALLRVLRRYADGPLAPVLSHEIEELAVGGRQGLPAFEEGSTQRQIAAVLVAIHEQLAALVLDLQLEIGAARLDASRWAEDVTPDQFGGESW